MSSKTVLKSLTIKNFRGYENCSFELDNQGLVLVRGDNGAGKSTIWDILEAIIYGSTPSGHKKDELTKNTDDAEATLFLEKNEQQISISLQRKNKKWSYEIKKDGEVSTDHTYYDAIKTATNLIGLTKNEFEGAVHLTQNAQHMLIKGSLSERKDYISSFFGIDTRYDEVHAATKEELEKVQNKIKNLAGLSHSQQMLTSQLGSMQVCDVSILQDQKSSLQHDISFNDDMLRDITTQLNVWDEYNKHYEAASLYKNPEAQIAECEARLIENQSKLKLVTQIKLKNQQAVETNNRIESLEEKISLSLEEYPALSSDTTEVNAYESELRDLSAIKTKNEQVSHLRKEISALPDVKEICVSKIEEELINLQVLHQTYLKNKKAKESGICTECGSTFNQQDVSKDVVKINEIKDSLDILQSDYTVLKNRNQNAKRRVWVLDQLKNVPDFSTENENRISFLRGYIQAKRNYENTKLLLAPLSRMELEGIPEVPEIDTDKKLLESLKSCVLAKRLLPTKPKSKKEILLKEKESLVKVQIELNNSLNSINQEIGKITAVNKNYSDISEQLKEIEENLKELDSLKKEEFFWQKMVDAYGPKGLRVTQLENMVDLLVKQVPVYSSIMFNEKHLTFKHKVDANNVKIIANREEVDEKSGKVTNKFQHDISCFSGGEKHKMSTASMLAFTDCIPVHKRTNVLILDEIDAELDHDGKFRFTNDLLPILKKKYSSIFVISHDENVQVANIYDKIWHISKKNHVSKLNVIIN